MSGKAKWPDRLVLIFGIANLAFALIGAVLAVEGLVKFRDIFHKEVPYFVQAFYTMTSINIVFLVWLAVTGVFLIKRNIRIIPFCNILFVLEIAYFIGISALWLNQMHGMGTGIGAATGIGNMGIALQLITGYPVISLVVLNIAREIHISTGIKEFV